MNSFAAGGSRRVLPEKEMMSLMVMLPTLACGLDEIRSPASASGISTSARRCSAAAVVAGSCTSATRI